MCFLIKLTLNYLIICCQIFYSYSFRSINTQELLYLPKGSTLLHQRKGIIWLGIYIIDLSVYHAGGPITFSVLSPLWWWNGFSSICTNIVTCVTCFVSDKPITKLKHISCWQMFCLQFQIWTKRTAVKMSQGVGGFNPQFAWCVRVLELYSCWPWGGEFDRQMSTQIQFICLGGG